MTLGRSGTTERDHGLRREDSEIANSSMHMYRLMTSYLELRMLERGGCLKVANPRADMEPPRASISSTTL